MLGTNRAKGETVVENKCYAWVNLALLDLLPPKGGRVLDCGCGAGDNARVLRARGCSVMGITKSESERDIALSRCDGVLIHDLETGIPEEVGANYDVVLMSHVLEHLVNPERVLTDARARLAPGGLLAVALPNVLTLHTRLSFLLGKFEYTETGILDDTHVRFYTFDSGRRLLERCGYRVILAQADGYAPLFGLQKILPRSWAAWLDRTSCRYWPGLLGRQSLYLARPDR